MSAVDFTVRAHDVPDGANPLLVERALLIYKRAIIEVAGSAQAVIDAHKLYKYVLQAYGTFPPPETANDTEREVVRRWHVLDLVASVEALVPWLEGTIRFEISYNTNCFQSGNHSRVAT